MQLFFFTLVPEVRFQNTSDEINHANGLLTLSRRKEKKTFETQGTVFCVVTQRSDCDTRRHKKRPLYKTKNVTVRD